MRRRWGGTSYHRSLCLVSEWRPGTGQTVHGAGTPPPPYVRSEEMGPFFAAGTPWVEPSPVQVPAALIHHRRHPPTHPPDTRFWGRGRRYGGGGHCSGPRPGGGANVGGVLGTTLLTSVHPRSSTGAGKRGWGWELPDTSVRVGRPGLPAVRGRRVGRGGRGGPTPGRSPLPPPSPSPAAAGRQHNGPSRWGNDTVGKGSLDHRRARGKAEGASDREREGGHT